MGEEPVHRLHLLRENRVLTAVCRTRAHSSYYHLTVEPEESCERRNKPALTVLRVQARLAGTGLASFGCNAILIVKNLARWINVVVPVHRI
jgi:hypothetical protein